MKWYRGYYRLLFLLCFSSVLFVQSCASSDAISAFNMVDVLLYRDATASSPLSGIEVLMSPGYEPGSDTFTCNQVPMLPDYVGHGPVHWAGTRGVSASSAEGGYRCIYHHANQQASFSCPASAIPRIVTPISGQTIHHTQLVVRFQPVTNASTLQMTSDVTLWQLESYSFVMTPDKGYFLITSTDLAGAPVGGATLTVMSTDRENLPQAPFHSVQCWERLSSSIPITIAP
jgi:hypothetical protein